ncbi:unnamed protein product [Vitrella brassicaformis CCMP3155]|uniref:GH16 domain-containing protein n=1 Tax=Vitrella brassicaformis (strain CCMP3155) TaxID=1169540 RepID=A0A0G4EBU5_VITBC|nr:unnamed protein product [Vitrella brassicaformis CCMP3155]|eukprot:CEL93007.1 unnamed protein product [Vitrella brassicaformis CCMP3155]
MHSIEDMLCFIFPETCPLPLTPSPFLTARHLSYEPDMSDEFDSRGLNESRWDLRRDDCGIGNDTICSPENVMVEGGLLKLRGRLDGPLALGAGIVAKTPMTHGACEVKLRFKDRFGWHEAAWARGVPAMASRGDFDWGAFNRLEIDMFENWFNGHMTQGGYMWLGEEETARAMDKPFFRAEGKTFVGHLPFTGNDYPYSAIPRPHKWHIYGYEANDKYWAFYIGGKLMYGGKKEIIDVRDIYSLPNFRPQHFVMFNVLATKGQSLRDGIEPTAGMDVDWVRCYSYNDQEGAASAHMSGIWETYPRLMPECISDPTRVDDPEWTNGSCRRQDVVAGAGPDGGQTATWYQLAIKLMQRLRNETGMTSEDIAPICQQLDGGRGERRVTMGNESWVPLAYAVCASRVLPRALK